MTSPGDDRMHDENLLLLRFCTAVHDTADTPTIINTVAGDADFVRMCKKLASPPTRVFEICFLALCNQRGFDAATIRRRVLSIARALRLSPASEAPADYYAILGVPADADEKAIKHAFREKAKVVHPDRQTENTDAFLDLQTAYHHLSDARLRARYDDEYQGSVKWIEPAEHPPRRPAADGRSFGMIGVLLAVLVTAAFIFDLFYNETSFFSGPEPAAPTRAPVNPGPRLPAQPALIDHTGQSAGTATARQSQETQMSPATEPGAAGPAATPVDVPGPPAVTTLQPLVPMMQPTPVPEIVLRQTAAAPETPPQPSAARRRAALEPTRSAAPSEPHAGNGASAVPAAGVGIPAPSSTAAAIPPLEQRLRAFLDTYCEAYASKNLEKFFTFFTRDATEQGQPVEKMLPVYRETFRIIKTVDYAIRIQAFTTHPQTGKVHVDGLFQAHYELNNGSTGNSSGTVFMDLAQQNEGFRVSNLGYAHN